MREEADEARHQMKEALKAHEELQKANEELQQALRGRTASQESYECPEHLPTLILLLR